MRDDPVVEATLNFCNSVREQKGMEPLDDLPKGHRFNPSSCPCGEATRAYVIYGSIFPDYDPETFKLGREVDLPSEVSLFARRFDYGDYPEYDADGGYIGQ